MTDTKTCKEDGGHYWFYDVTNTQRVCNWCSFKQKKIWVDTK